MPLAISLCSSVISLSRNARFHALRTTEKNHLAHRLLHSSLFESPPGCLSQRRSKRRVASRASSYINQQPPMCLPPSCVALRALLLFTSNPHPATPLFIHAQGPYLSHKLPRRHGHRLYFHLERRSFYMRCKRNVTPSLPRLAALYLVVLVCIKCSAPGPIYLLRFVTTVL